MKGAGAANRGASPGGPALSAAKRRRLAALDDAFGGPAPRAASEPQPSAAVALGAGTGAKAADPAVAAPARAGPAAGTDAGQGQFPYNPLGDAVLDGALSAILAQVQPPSAATRAATGSKSPARGGRPGSGPGSARDAAEAPAGAAAELLTQLVATNPRASEGDVAALLSSRLADRSVLLDNPVAQLKAGKMFGRRTSTYSSGLRSGAARKRATVEPTRQLSSYAVAMRLHEMWQRYAQDVLRGLSSGAGGGAGAGSAAGGPPGPEGAADRVSRLLDLHGAVVHVVQHASPCYVGAAGVVVRRSAACLHIVTAKDRRQVIPLQGCVARYAVGNVTLQLAG